MYIFSFGGGVVFGNELIVDYYFLEIGIGFIGVSGGFRIYGLFIVFFGIDL